MKRMFLLSAVLVLFSFFSICCWAADDEAFLEDDPFAEPEIAKLYDPLEPVNRGIFWVNDKLYIYLFKPVAKGLRVLPEPVRISTSNFFDNLATPVRVVNNLLQLKLDNTGSELARFVINTTLGLGGLFDPAKDWGLEEKTEDFGQTFGHYGIGHGFYLVLPILGPSSVRDGIGKVGDYFLDPLPYALKSEETLALWSLKMENSLSLDKDTYESIREHELDPYLFVRDAYNQHRSAEVRE